MVALLPGDSGPQGHLALLCFDSAVVPRRGRVAHEKLTMGFAFHALLGVHRLHSRLLVTAVPSGVVRLPRGQHTSAG